MYKLQRKIGTAGRALVYFATRQWEFKNLRVQNLWKMMESTDRQLFPFRIQNVDWDEHSMHMIRGIRKYIVRDKDDNLAVARRRHF